MTQHALSLKQPWAALLAAGLKTIEVRRWPTSYRGELLIHAARLCDERPEAWARLPAELTALAQLRGGIIGAGRLTGCKAYRSASAFAADGERHLNEASWFEPAGLFGFHFEDLRVVPFRRYPGWVRIFEVHEEAPKRARRRKQPDSQTGSQPDSETADDQTQTPAGGEPPVSPSPCLPQAGPHLLVRVRSAREAEAALAGGAALLDVLEPARGPLGRADEAVVREVLARVGGRVPVSVALGEYADWRGVLAGLAGCRYVAWGPAGLRDLERLRLAHEQAVQEVGRALPGCQVVLVAYADWRRAQAPQPEEVCGFACQRPGSVLLLDTFEKPPSGGGGRWSLLDFLPAQRVALLTRLARASGVRVALAGSLGKREIEQLLSAAPEWFAVRGAVCSAGGEGEVQTALVRELAEVVRRGRKAEG